MVSEYPAARVQFAGLGAEGDTAPEAAVRLATGLREWAAAHEECRILQLSVVPPAGVGAQGDAPKYGLTAILAFVETGLSSADAAQAVAAAVDEIHEAQSSEPGRPL